MYRPAFDLDALRTFVTVVKLSSFTAASLTLAKTQSTVSHQIRRLESQLGFSLLERTTRSVSLTPVGQRFYGDAEAILALAASAEARLKANQIRGEVKLGVPEEVACSFLPEVASTFRPSYPSVRLAITVGVSGVLLQLLDEGELDLAVIKRSPPGRGAIAAERLCWASRIDAAKSAVLPVAFFPEPCEVRARTIDALEAAGRNYDIVMTTTSHESLRAVCSRGIAASVLSASQCPENIRLEESTAKQFGLPALPEVGYEVRQGPNETPASEALSRVLAQAFTRHF